jgi:FKBP-type peptidyl-prolyl cis-trans isomerase
VTPPPAGDRVDDPGSVAVGDTVTVHARGSVAESGAKTKQFWSTRDEGQTAFTYGAGVGAVIPGWDQALLGARAGEVREARIPAKEGYGAGGFPAWGIPPGATLAFEIEVVKNEGRKAP